MKPTEKELLEFVAIFDAMFKKGGELDMFLDKTVKHKDNKITEQEIDKKAKELLYVKNMQDLGLRDTRFPSLEEMVRPYTFELPLTFKEFDTYYTLSKDIVGLDKTQLSFVVEGLVANLSYNNLNDTRRTEFEWAFELPEISDLDNILITYVDGCLTITIPKLANKIKHYTVQ